MAKIQADYVVVGAGVFGVWSALALRESGADTLLLDAWGVAHPRATSAGESRIIRAGYGDHSLYTDWAWQSLREWRRRETEWDDCLLVQSGVLWLGRAGEPHLAASRDNLEQRGIPLQEIRPDRLSRQFPALSGEGIEEAFLEPEAGVLLARKACRRTAQAFAEAGGRFEFRAALPPKEDSSTLSRLPLANGDVARAEQFLFCCGPWLPELLPDLPPNAIRVTRQEVFFFGTPRGSSDYYPPLLPAWIEFGEERLYGIPAIDGRGLKAARDESGPVCDATHQQRSPSEAELARVGAYLERRFPAMKGAPLVETRVCQYERTPDNHLIVDRHPKWSNVIVAGGGSGHGFKLGPAVGKLAAGMALGKIARPPSALRLEADRFG